MRPFMTEALEAIADRFHPREGIKAIRSLGSGNVNETFLVTHEGQGGAFVMQRLNTNVFDRPDLVMQNLQALGDHMERRLASPPPQLKGRRWEVPRVVPCRRGPPPGSNRTESSGARLRTSAQRPPAMSSGTVPMPRKWATGWECSTT